ncbi:MAG: ABC transporter ATP-binding protein [Chloroflexota bacterium]|nr:ABC transporter ATP-binding protein [Chloroflexota bacterium]
MIKVTVEHLSKRYGKTKALDDVALEFRAGELTAILGPSGCGKTTLLRSIAGFVETDGGTIRFDDVDVTALTPQERDTAMVFQNYALWPHMTIFQNVAYGLKLKRMEASTIERQVMEALDMVEMTGIIGEEGIMRRRPSELSGGQQQRVALARALVVQPKVLLLDEPLSNLDAKVRQRVRVEIRRLQRRIGITTIHVTHDQEEALSIADRVVIMDHGVVVQAGTPEEIYQQPNCAFVAEFLGNSNVLTGSASADGRSIELAGNSIPWPGVSGLTTIIFRADDVSIHPDAAALPPDAVILRGQVEEVLFVGYSYRYLIRIGQQTALVDGSTIVPKGPAVIAIPRDKLQVYTT